MQITSLKVSAKIPLNLIANVYKDGSSWIKPYWVTYIITFTYHIHIKKAYDEITFVQRRVSVYAHITLMLNKARTANDASALIDGTRLYVRRRIAQVWLNLRPFTQKVQWLFFSQLCSLYICSLRKCPKRYRNITYLYVNQISKYSMSSRCHSIKTDVGILRRSDSVIQWACLYLPQVTECLRHLISMFYLLTRQCAQMTIIIKLSI